MQQFTRIGIKLVFSLIITRSMPNSCNREQLSLLPSLKLTPIREMPMPQGPSSPLLDAMRVPVELLSSALQVKRMTRYICEQNRCCSHLCIITQPVPECSDAACPRWRP